MDKVNTIWWIFKCTPITIKWITFEKFTIVKDSFYKYEWNARFGFTQINYWTGNEILQKARQCWLRDSNNEFIAGGIPHFPMHVQWKWLEILKYFAKLWNYITEQSSKTYIW